MEFSSSSPETPGPPVQVPVHQHPLDMGKECVVHTWIHEHCAAASASSACFDDSESAVPCGDIVVVKRDLEE